MGTLRRQCSRSSQSRRWGAGLGTIVVWVFNSVGTVDLLNAFYQGDRLGVGISPGLQGAAYFIPTVVVPLLLVTHALVFRILVGTASLEVRNV